MRHWIFFLGLALLFSLGCQKDENLLLDEPFSPANVAALEKPAPVKTVRVGGQITLMLGETVKVVPDNFTITFRSIPEDSRCPKGVTCFWEGRAVIGFAFEKYDDFFLRNLATPNSQMEPPTATVIFNRTVRLLEVAPYPQGERPIPPGMYRVTIGVEQGAELGGDK
ncbi:MAG: hypothetical protein AAB316_20655 [Bacteroidota bacterium]